ncbi:PHP domain-containing protein [Desulfosediminicola sp.]|uniref:PHP domain-containing protein n=1 Tax=Desulfosediminicola sp. TaxID=2886825 RepID=UPI003AF235B5
MALDLHIHSTFSDGTMTPTQLVELAKKKGLKAIALTDHDTAEGVAEAVAAGERLEVEVVSGIEFGVIHKETHFHMLGYGFDYDDSHLLGVLSTIQANRDDRNKQMITRLQGFGIDISSEEVAAKSQFGQTGRPHIAQVLVEKKQARSIDDAFSRFLKRGAIAYVPRRVLSAKEAIDTLHGAGGVAVMAHPVTIDTSLQNIVPLLNILVHNGLDGIEAYYPTHSTKQRKHICSLADRYSLVVTGGSDYHGDIRPGTTLAGGKNVHVPAKVLEPLKRQISKIRQTNNNTGV